MLQSEALDLAGAMCWVGATLKTITDCQKEEKYIQVYRDADELADRLNIPQVESQRRSHRTRTPFRLSVLESTGDHSFDGESEHSAIYFAVIDNFIAEIKARFRPHPSRYCVQS